MSTTKTKAGRPGNRASAPLKRFSHRVGRVTDFNRIERRLAAQSRMAREAGNDREFGVPARVWKYIWFPKRGTINRATLQTNPNLPGRGEHHPGEVPEGGIVMSRDTTLKVLDFAEKYDLSINAAVMHCPLTKDSISAAGRDQGSRGPQIGLLKADRSASGVPPDYSDVTVGAADELDT